MSKNKKLLMYDFLITSISAMVWSGFPVYFFNQTGSFVYAGSMYLIGGITSITSSFAGNYLYKNISKKSVSMYLYLLLLISLISYFILISHEYHFMFILLLILQLSLNSANFMFEALFNSSLSDTPHKSISSRISLLLTAKTVSFSLGPLAFTFLEHNIFVVFISIYIFILFSWNSYFPNNISTFTQSSSTLLSSFFILPIKLAMIFFIDGMILPVIMNYSLLILKEEFQATDLIISTFWFIGGTSIILSNTILKRFNYIQLKNNSFYPLILFILGLSIMIFSKHVFLYLTGFLIIALSNPYFFIILKSESLIKVPVEHRSSSLMWGNIFSQLGTILFIFITLLSLGKYKIISLKDILIFIMFLTLLRFLFLHKFLKKERDNLGTT